MTNKPCWDCDGNGVLFIAADDSRRSGTMQCSACATPRDPWVALAESAKRAIEAIRSWSTPDEPCRLPPAGWSCSRKAGHDGPCPTRPLEEAQPTWQDYEIDTDDVCTLEGFDGVCLFTGEIAASAGLRMSRETARALANRLDALLRCTAPSVHAFAGVEQTSAESHLRSVLWEILGGLGAESVKITALRVVTERDLARTAQGQLRAALKKLRPFFGALEPDKAERGTSAWQPAREAFAVLEGKTS